MDVETIWTFGQFRVAVEVPSWNPLRAVGPSYMGPGLMERQGSERSTGTGPGQDGHSFSVGSSENLQGHLD